MGPEIVDVAAGLNGVEPKRSSLNGSELCDVPLCVCVRLDESRVTLGGGATVNNENKNEAIA